MAQPPSSSPIKIKCANRLTPISAHDVRNEGMTTRLVLYNDHKCHAHISAELRSASQNRTKLRCLYTAEGAFLKATLAYPTRILAVTLPSLVVGTPHKLRNNSIAWTLLRCRNRLRPLKRYGDHKQHKRCHQSHQQHTSS
jgi:hypothetical protein